MAVKVMDKCYSASEEKAQCLLIKEIEKFDDSTVLQIAVASEDLKIVAHPCTQGLLTKLWYHKISLDVKFFYVIFLDQLLFLDTMQNFFFFLISKLKFALSIINPFLAPIVFEFKEERKRIVYKVSSKTINIFILLLNGKNWLLRTKTEYDFRTQRIK
jgi:hypothetical protein